MARALGASEEAAANIGVAVDVGLPLGIGLAGIAARVLAVRGGTVKLAMHEAAQGSRIGGHTMGKHIGWTEDMLRARVAARNGPELASSFRNLEVAEEAISRALRANRRAIHEWAQRAAASPQRVPPKAFEADLGQIVGIGVHRLGHAAMQLSRVRVVLKYETYNGMKYYVLTAFPIP
jgi:Bacterial CdiA-CT RNAse A domain